MMGCMTHFAAGMVSQVLPINLELTMVVHVYQFVDESLLHVFLAEEMTSTKYDGSRIRAEPAGTRQIAGSAKDIRRRHLTTR